MNSTRMFACLLAASLLPTFGQGPLYTRIGGLVTYDDWRSYNGGQLFGLGLEVGYIVQGVEKDAIGFAFHAGLLRSRGKARVVDALPQTPDATQSIPLYHAEHGLKGWKAGVDVLLATPMPALTGYMGFALHGWTGDRTVVQGTAEKHVFQADSKGKLGIRVGLQYQVSGAWSITADYNVSMWRSEIVGSATKPVKGINPMKPSWTMLSAQYRF